MAAIFLCRIDGPAPPTGSNFDHPVIRREFQFSADSIELCDGCVVKRCFGSLKNPRGVSHRVVEEKTVEVISQIVMLTDVSSGTLQRIFPQPMNTPRRKMAPVSDAAIEPVHQVHVSNEKPHGLGQGFA